MYAVIGILKRNEGMSREEFRRWWLEEHVPHVMRMPGVVHYVTHPIDETRATLERDEFEPTSDVDGIALVYYESREVYHQALASQAGSADKASLQVGVGVTTVYYGSPQVHINGLVGI